MEKGTSITPREDGAPVPTDRGEPDSKLDRLVEDTKSLTDDVSEWLRLKIQLIQIEVHERVTEELNALFSSILVLGLLLVAILLAMVGLAFFIGELVGSEPLGFGVVALLVVVVAILLGRTHPQWIGDVMYFLVPRRWLKGIRSKNDDPRKN